VSRETGAINLGRGHDRPERARARLLTGEVVTAAAADYASYRPRLDETSRRAIESADRPHAPSADSGPAGSPDTADARETAGHARWLALCQAPDDGADVTGLMRMTGWARTRLYRRRRQYAGAGRTIGLSGGRCRARRPGGRPL
jgi:S-DNA-T family DNA segregation ATPase FtsK/SpoIIIE